MITPPPPKKNQKRRDSRIMDFAVTGDNNVKIKENEKRDMYLDFARELR